MIHIHEISYLFREIQLNSIGIPIRSTPKRMILFFQMLWICPSTSPICLSVVRPLPVIAPRGPTTCRRAVKNVSAKIRQMTPKYRQFASLIVLRWVNVSWKARNSSNDAETSSIYLSMVESQFHEILHQITLKRHIWKYIFALIDFFFQSQ